MPEALKPGEYARIFCRECVDNKVPTRLMPGLVVGFGRKVSNGGMSVVVTCSRHEGIVAEFDIAEAQTFELLEACPEFPRDESGEAAQPVCSHKAEGLIH